MLGFIRSIGLSLIPTLNPASEVQRLDWLDAVGVCPPDGQNHEDAP
jgi:hypothetical protein